MVKGEQMKRKYRNIILINIVLLLSSCAGNGFQLEETKVVGNTEPTNGFNAEIDEIQEIVDKLVDVKSIEENIILGYPIEEVLLSGELKNSREISVVLDHLRTYYEEQVIEDYLYYLKRSYQKFYPEVGVFWRGNLLVNGNVYKREATSVSYDIHYVSVTETEDIVSVITKVTPIYTGKYIVRGEKSIEYRGNEKIFTFNLRKQESGEYKLVKLENSLVAMMEAEIGEKLHTAVKEEMPEYPLLKSISFESESQKKAYYLAFDAATRLQKNGLDNLYDQYAQVWLDQEEVWFLMGDDYQKFIESIEKKTPEERLNLLKVDYEGWEYAFSLPNYSRKIMVFNVDENGDIEAMAFMMVVERGIEEDFKRHESDVRSLISNLDEERKIMFDNQISVHEKVLQLVELNKNYYNKALYGQYQGTIFSNKQYNYSFYPGSILGYMTMRLEEIPRFSSAGGFPSIYVDLNKEAHFIFPPGQYQGEELAKSRILTSFFYTECVGSPNLLCTEDEEEVVYISVEDSYLFPEINVYIYDEISIEMMRRDEKSNWKISSIYPVWLLPGADLWSYE